MNRRLLQLGFLLILIALLTGLAVPFTPVPRLALAAHTAGIQGGLVLIALGALAGAFELGTRASGIMTWSWTYAAYANWLACLLGAASGATRLTPMAGGGAHGTATWENVVAFLLESLAAASILGTSLAVWGLRPRHTDR